MVSEPFSLKDPMIRRLSLSALASLALFALTPARLWPTTPATDRDRARC